MSQSLPAPSRHVQADRSQQVDLLEEGPPGSDAARRWQQELPEAVMDVPRESKMTQCAIVSGGGMSQTHAHAPMQCAGVSEGSMSPIGWAQQHTEAAMVIQRELQVIVSEASDLCPRVECDVMLARQEAAGLREQVQELQVTTQSETQCEA